MTITEVSEGCLRKPLDVVQELFRKRFASAADVAAGGDDFGEKAFFQRIFEDPNLATQVITEPGQKGLIQKDRIERPASEGFALKPLSHLPPGEMRVEYVGSNAPQERVVFDLFCFPDTDI